MYLKQWPFLSIASIVLSAQLTAAQPDQSEEHNPTDWQTLFARARELTRTAQELNGSLQESCKNAKELTTHWEKIAAARNITSAVRENT